jgi:hypothetical protein
VRGETLPAETSDHARVRYEALRRDFLGESRVTSNTCWESFSSFGLFGLLSSRRHESYTVESYQAPPPRWCGGVDPAHKALQGAFAILMKI